MNAAVEAAIYAARAPERQWQAEQATLQSQITALSSLQSAASALSADLQSLNDPLGSLAARSASSSNPSVVTATATAGTVAGSHSVAVSQLATAASWYSPVVPGTTSSLGSSTLTITQKNGAQTSFDLSSAANSSVSGLVRSINAANLGVVASTVQDASGVRLALRGSSTGSGADFSVADTANIPASSWNSAEVLNSSPALGESTFQVGDGTSTATIQVAAGATLEGVAQQVNASGLSLTAQVVQDDSGAHLSVTGTGSAQVTLSNDPTLPLARAATAQDAVLTVDGVPVTSSSNTVSGALAGVTLNLSGVMSNSTPASINISADSGQITSAISQFVSDFNSMLSQVSSQFAFSGATGSQGVLSGDSVVRSLQAALLGSVSISSANSTSVRSLADLGISMKDDGTLTLDAGKLTQLVNTDPDALQAFLQGGSQAGFAATARSQLNTFSSSGGSLSMDVKNLTAQYNSLQASISDFESGYIASQQTLLTSMYSKAEIALQSLPNTLKQISAELNNSAGNQ